MCSMLLTVVVIARSEMVTMRPSTSFGESPVNCQMIEITGMLMLGKMSIGVRAIVSAPPIAMRNAITMKVYGRRRARRTIHIAQLGAFSTHGAALRPSMARVQRNSRAAEWGSESADSLDG